MLATYLEEGKKIKERVYLLLMIISFLFRPTGLLAIQIMKVFLKY